jgi:hypothetical protein
MDLLARQSTTDLSQHTMPSFEAVWAEALQFLLSHHQFSDPNFILEDYSWFVDDEVEYFGTSCKRLVQMIFENLRAVPVLVQWIDTFITKPPKYIDTQANFIEQLSARTTDGPNVLLDIDRVVGAFRFDDRAIQSVDRFFGSLVKTAANYLWSQNGELNAELIDHDMEPLVDGLSSLVTHPFSSKPIRIRQQASQINIRGTFRLLLHNAATLANSTHPLTEVQWRMFQFFLHGLHKTALTCDCVESVRKTLEILKLTEFLMSMQHLFRAGIIRTFKIY